MILVIVVNLVYLVILDSQVEKDWLVILALLEVQVVKVFQE